MPTSKPSLLYYLLTHIFLYLNKSVVRTRSVTKNEIACKKPTTATHKTDVKIQVATKQITTKTSIKQPIKSKMCLRSFRGRYIHKELNVKTHKKRPKVPQVKPIKTSTPKKIETEQSSSEFSSDDDEPLIKTRAVKKVANPVKKHRRTIENNVRLTRSHNKLVVNKLQKQRKQTHLKHHRRIITRLSTGTVKNKIVQSSSIIRNLRRSVNTITRRRNQKVPQVIRTTRQRIFKSKVEKSNDSGEKNNSSISNKVAQTRSKTVDNVKVVLTKEIGCKKEELSKNSVEQASGEDVCKKRSAINKNVKPEKPIAKEISAIKKDIKTREKIMNKSNSGKIEPNKRFNRSVSPNIQTKRKSPVSTIAKKLSRSRSSSSAESIEEEQNTKTKEIGTENTIRRRPNPKKKIIGEKVPGAIAGRPSRKTKEAAAIYMELLGHKLVNSSVIDDDDDESIDSFPELPNVRKTEQRENELKAKATKSKTNTDREESNDKVIGKEEDATTFTNSGKKEIDKVKANSVEVNSEKSKNKAKITGEARKDVEKNKIGKSEKSSPKKADTIPITKEVETAKEEKIIVPKQKISKEVNQNSGIPKGIVSRQQRSVTESDIDNAMASVSILFIHIFISTL